MIDALLLKSKSMIKTFLFFLKLIPLTYGHMVNKEMKTIKLV